MNDVSGLDDVRGAVATGFDHVVEEFAKATAEGGELGAAAAATIDGELVVDLWRGEAAPGRPWDRDTLVCVYSCTKGLAALCAHMLSERGLLDVDAPVTRYWPEYGANGKESTLVRHILSHQAGLVTLPRYWEVIGPDGLILGDLDFMATSLAALPPAFEPGTAVAYHALTYGSLVGELVRRIDGRTIGRFFAEEVAGPLDLDLYIGLPDDLVGRVSDTRVPEVPPDPAAATAALEVWRTAEGEILSGEMVTPEAMLFASLFAPPGEDPTDWITRLMNHPTIRRSELAGGNAIGTARALAGMYVPLATGGGGLVSPQSIEQWSTEQLLPDGTPTMFALGYAVYGTGFGGPEVEWGAFGHPGAGGNVGLADPTRHVSYGYVKNCMVADPDVPWRPLRALYSCLNA